MSKISLEINQSQEHVKSQQFVANKSWIALVENFCVAIIPACWIRKLNAEMEMQFSVNSKSILQFNDIHHVVLCRSCFEPFVNACNANLQK